MRSDTRQQAAPAISMLAITTLFSLATAGSAGAQTVVILEETFEGAFPSGSWQVSGDPTWDDDDYKPYTGSWSAWCANGGSQGLDPQVSTYRDNMDAWMFYGPFSLLNATSVTLSFDLWLQTELDYDFFHYGRLDECETFVGESISGTTGGWSHRTFDLSAAIGEPYVCIAFGFTSDQSVSFYQGVFVDNVRIEATVEPYQACCMPDGTCRNLGPTACLNQGGVPGGPDNFCGSDVDADGIAEGCDNCPSISNINQLDSDADGMGDACDTAEIINGEWNLGEMGWTRWREYWGSSEQWNITMAGPTAPEGTLSNDIMGEFGWYQVIQVSTGGIYHVRADWAGNLGSSGAAAILFFEVPEGTRYTDIVSRTKEHRPTDIAFMKDGYGMNPPSIWGWEPASLSPYPSGVTSIRCGPPSWLVVALDHQSSTSTVSFDNIRVVLDTDHDGHPDGADNCPYVSNPTQADTNIDGTGDACSNMIISSGDDQFGQCDVPAPNAAFTAIAANSYHSVGLKANGTVVAWGGNWAGQCNVPPPNQDYIAVDAGYDHSLGLKAEGTIVAWGYNGSGQCNVPAVNARFEAVSAGHYHSLGLRKDGSTVAWGDNAYGQCNAPVPNEGFAAISAGAYHNLGLKTDHSIFAWGHTAFGQCDVPSPNQDFVAVAAGYGHSLGLKSDGSIVAWGRNNGECDVPAPNQGFIAIAAADYRSMGLKADGSIVVWGDYNGQDGIPEPNQGFIAMAGSYYHFLGLKPDRDGDESADVEDNCPYVANPDQTDRDHDGLGDACDPFTDPDQDGYRDEDDNCPDLSNHDQTDSDADGRGDACDNCLFEPNADQSDEDADWYGDACDDCPHTLPYLPVDENGCPPYIVFDFDRDGDVDLMDLNQFVTCSAGPGIASPPGDCLASLFTRSDTDNDLDVDSADFGHFQRCYSGENRPANPSCE